jgi:alpha-ketoglutarate-dependent taurine dioxygenase
LASTHLASTARVSLADADIQLITDRLIPFDQALDAWPTAPPPHLEAESLECRGELNRLLRDRPGYAVVDTGLADAGDDVVCSAAWNLFTALWRPMPQYSSGELLFPVEVVPDAPGKSLSQTNASGVFHTDGTVLPEAPAVAALFCLSSADAGGETVLVDGAALHESMARSGDGLIEALLAQHPVDCHGQSPDVEVRRQPTATRGEDGQLHLRYLRRYIEEGYEKVGEEIPSATRAAFDYVDRFAAAEEHQIPVALTRGELLVFSNDRFLHGRRAFRDGAKRRRLRRAYGAWPSAPLSRSSPTRA